jgi:tetratricopeptide (TPR) repeat protein
MIKRGGLISIVFIGLMMGVFPYGAEAQNRQTPAEVGGAGVEASQGGDDIGVILNTLNEALDENRQLRNELQTAREEMKKVVLEGNALRGQVRIFERDKERIEKQWEDRVAQLTDELRGRREEIRDLEDQIRQIQTKTEDLEREKGVLRDEQRKLSEVLESGMIVGEPEEYGRLLEQAQESSEGALRKVREAEAERERLREESADLNFQLGTIAFRHRDFESAVRYFQTTLRLRPSDANAHHNLGIIFDYYIPDPDRAIYHYRQYLNMIPVQETAHEIRERILTLRLGKSITPPAEPLKKEFFKNRHYTN